MNTKLYRYFDCHKQLLYVGVSVNAVVRMAQHKKNAPWFSAVSSILIEDFPTRLEALKAETLAIATEHPMYNIIGRGDETFSCIKTEFLLVGINGLAEAIKMPMGELEPITKQTELYNTENTHE